MTWKKIYEIRHKSLFYHVFENSQALHTSNLENWLCFEKANYLLTNENHNCMGVCLDKDGNCYTTVSAKILTDISICTPAYSMF